MSEKFRLFVEDRKDEGVDLPLLHTTSAVNFEKIAEENSLKAQYCKVFKKNLTYMFFGRPAYKTENSKVSNLSFNWPFVFVFDPKKIDQIEAVYPFDTGAFHNKFYSEIFPKSSKLEHFELPGCISYASTLVKIFYGNAKAYLNGRSFKNVEMPLKQFEAEGIQFLTQSAPYIIEEAIPGFSRDERSNSIEVQTTSRIDLSEAILAVIIPSGYMDDGDTLQALERWNVKIIKTYEVLGFAEPGSWMASIYQRTYEIYDELGYACNE